MKRLFVLATLMVLLQPPCLPAAAAAPHTTKIESPAQSTGV